MRTAYLVTGLAFACCYGQAPLFYSNQNQYFLHGMAQAGVGELASDWLAQTADPTALFSLLVEGVARTLPIEVFYGIQFFLLMLYGASMLGLYAGLVGRERAEQNWPLFTALFLLTHAAALRWLTFRLFDLDYAWYFQSGVAGQYLLGGMIQPSMFGVLLATALACFALGRPLWAAFFVAAGGTIHATYLLPGACLIAGFFLSLWLRGERKQAVVTAGLALVLVLATVVFNVVRFGLDRDPRALDVMVNVRIPHHCRVDLWLDPVAWLQIGWMVFGIVCAWGTRLFTALLTAFLLAAAGTFLQVQTGSLNLAQLFPWRLSALLVPVASVIIVGRIACLLPVGRIAKVLSSAVMLLLAVTGLWISLGRLAFQMNQEEEGLYEFVRAHVKPGEIYLIPVKLPNLAATVRGSRSSDFKPVQAKKTDTQVIPIDLQRFRLHGQAPIYVDFKSIPYRDDELLTWRDRMIEAEAALKSKGPELVAWMHERKLTHLVQPSSQPAHDGWQIVYADRYYRVMLPPPVKQQP